MDENNQKEESDLKKFKKVEEKYKKQFEDEKFQEQIEERVTEADKLVIPSKPVELLAHALAVEERGEDGGMTSVSAYARATNALQDAISLDSNKHSEELIWYES